jgi:hypothetical protein
MKNLGSIFLRALVIAVVVVLVTGIIYAVYGGQTASGLSDWLVIASFLTLSLGTLVGVGNLGYKRTPVSAGEPPEGRFEHLVKDLFLAGPFGISLALAGPLCFGAAVLVDLLF